MLKNYINASFTYDNGIITCSIYTSLGEKTYNRPVVADIYNTIPDLIETIIWIDKIEHFPNTTFDTLIKEFISSHGTEGIIMIDPSEANSEMMYDTIDQVIKSVDNLSQDLYNNNFIRVMFNRKMARSYSKNVFVYSNINADTILNNTDIVDYVSKRDGVIVIG